MDHQYQPDDQIINPKMQKRVCRTVNIAVSPKHKVKLKGIGKKVKYLRLFRELKNCGT